MASFLQKLFGVKTDSKVPAVPPPIPIPEMAQGEDVLKSMKKRKGRAKTILTGDLAPMDIGKRTLLG